MNLRQQGLKLLFVIAKELMDLDGALFFAVVGFGDLASLHINQLSIDIKFLFF
jgi:hypothetical protein